MLGFSCTGIWLYNYEVFGEDDFVQKKVPNSPKVVKPTKRKRSRKTIFQLNNNIKEDKLCRKKH